MSTAHTHANTRLADLHMHARTQAHASNTQIHVHICTCARHARTKYDRHNTERGNNTKGYGEAARTGNVNAPTSHGKSASPSIGKERPGLRRSLDSAAGPMPAFRPELLGGDGPNSTGARQPSRGSGERGVVGA